MKSRLTNLTDPRFGAYAVRTLIPMLLMVAVLVSSACSVHRIDVQQGNAITKEQLEKLKIGMAKRQVSSLLGTPLIEDPFHKGRWDYYYKFIAGDTDEEQSSYLTLHFDGDRLSKIDVNSPPIKETDLKKTMLKSQ